MTAPGYGKYSRQTDDHGSGALRCWWFRWQHSKPGMYIVTTDYDGLRRGEPMDLEFSHAVVDDFGNLRRVAA